jgi:hypothetical protein
MRVFYNGYPHAGHVTRVLWSADLVRSLPLVAVLVAALAPALSGCVVVRANQREFHAKRAMTNDRDPGEVRFGQHATGSREGADGGTGQPGGGCGCN